VQEASPLTAWESFYVIIGSSGAALTGLMFVVIALIAELRPRTSGRTVSAFGTPTVVHFCSVLLVSALLSAPWRTLWSLGVFLGLFGVAGVAYVLIILRRARRQTDYRPVMEDWVWHTILPLLAYVAIAGAAIALAWRPVQALFVIGAATISLLFVGIHNAWDTVTFIVVERAEPQNQPESQPAE